MCCSKARPSQSGPDLSRWDGKSVSKHPLPPIFASLFSIFYPQNIVCIGLTRRRKPLLFNTLQDSSQDIPYKGVTGKIFRNKDLPDAHFVSAHNRPSFERPGTAARIADWRCGRLAPALSVYDAEVSWTSQKTHSRTRR